LICLEVVVKMGKKKKPGKKVRRGLPKPFKGGAKATRVRVAVIVGRASLDKVWQMSWRAAARALAPIVFEGLRVNKPFKDLGALKKPIGKLYIICHSDPSGIGEYDADGTRLGKPVDDVAGRIKNAAGALGDRAPKLIWFLSCFGGGRPETISKIGRALGATLVRAPIHMTVISSIFIYDKNAEGKKTLLPHARIKRLSDSKLSAYIKHPNIDGLKYYDFVPGVPHPKSGPSRARKLESLVSILRKTGSIPRVSFNEPPDHHEAVPYWKASIQRRKPTGKVSTPPVGGPDLIEVKLKK